MNKKRQQSLGNAVRPPQTILDHKVAERKIKVPGTKLCHGQGPYSPPPQCHIRPSCRRPRFVYKLEISWMTPSANICAGMKEEEKLSCFTSVIVLSLRAVTHPANFTSKFHRTLENWTRELSIRTPVTARTCLKWLISSNTTLFKTLITIPTCHIWINSLPLKQFNDIVSQKCVYH